MTNEQLYTFYKTEKSNIQHLIDEHEEKVESKRQELNDWFIGETGADSYADNGRGTGYAALEENSLLKIEPYIKLRFMQKGTAFCIGKNNYKKGKQLNAAIEKMEKEMISLPRLEDYIFNKLGIQSIQWKSVNGGVLYRAETGMALINNVVAIRIPKPIEDGAKEIKAPDFMEEITYGEFYDLTH